jgi:serine/threonine-protein kinase
MATVYLAEDLRHRRRVAIKVLRADLAQTLGPDRFGVGICHGSVQPIGASG